MSPYIYVRYGLEAAGPPLGFGQPGLISIPLSFITLGVVSLLTQKLSSTEGVAAGIAD